MVAPGLVIRNNHFQLLNMLWKCGSNSQIWINNNSNDDGDSNDNNDDNKNNKVVNLMFNSTLATKRALKWVHTKLKLKGMHYTTKHTGRIEVTYPAFLTLTPKTVKWLSSSSNCFTARALLPTTGKRVRSSGCSSHSIPTSVATWTVVTNITVNCYVFSSVKMFGSKKHLGLHRGFTVQIFFINIDINKNVQIWKLQPMQKQYVLHFQTRNSASSSPV